MQRLDAQALANFIIDKIEEMGLEMLDCIAQCSDGAYIINGWASGVQARIAEKIPSCHIYTLPCTSTQPGAYQLYLQTG